MTLLERLLLVAVVAALTTKVPIKRHKICVTRRRTTRKDMAVQGKRAGAFALRRKKWPLEWSHSEWVSRWHGRGWDRSPLKRK